MNLILFSRIAAQLIGSNVGSSVRSSGVASNVSSQPIIGIVIVSSLTSKMPGQVKCTGINDDQSIQNAINAINNGAGKIVLSDGVFNLNGSIVLINNLTISGQGDGSSVLKV